MGDERAEVERGAGTPRPPAHGTVGAQPEAQAGIESIETGMRLLLVLSRLGGRPQMLGTLASAAGMSPPKVHRYLVSLVRTGFVERDARRGRYRLGPSALEVGVSAIGSVDALRLAGEVMPGLRDELNHTIALMVWGNHGPIIVRAEESNDVVSVSFRVGRGLPILGSASGLALAAHLPWAAVSTAIAAEIGAAPPAHLPRPVTLEQVQRRLSLVRRRGLARIRGTVTSGISALAAPILDVRGYAAASLSVVGTSGSFDMRAQALAASALSEVCADLSRRLGHRPPTATSS